MGKNLSTYRQGGSPPDHVADERAHHPTDPLAHRLADAETVPLAHPAADRSTDKEPYTTTYTTAY